MLAEQKSIAVFRALQLGDMLCVVPALRAFRAAAPQAHITLIGLPWAADFARRFSMYVDEFVAFPGFPSFPERKPDHLAFPGFLHDMQERHFDLVIQMHGSGSLSNPLLMLFGAKNMAGYYVEGQYRPNAEHFLPWSHEEHEVRRFLRLVQHLGTPTHGEELEFPFSMENDVAVHANGPYVCIHPGARLPSRRWFPQRFAQLADRLAEDGYGIVLTGTGEETELTKAVMAHMRAPAVDVCGKTNLDGMANLLTKASLLVCNDTGVSHIAAALGVPSVVVACGSEVSRWAPLNRARHHILAIEMECRPCMHEICPVSHACANAVHVDMVYEEALKLLPSPRLLTGSTR